MQKKVFICTNNKQILGALVSRFSIERNLQDKNSIKVEIINVDDLEIFRNFKDETFKRGGGLVTYSPDDLQSFTLSRFMPPELMGYTGKAIVIDPDIFALSDVGELFNMDINNVAIVACPKRDAWDSSVMLLNCSKLTHWNIEHILSELKNKEVDYEAVMQLRNETSIAKLSREWNSLDALSKNTKLLHTTERLTQPWKSGLPIDFTRTKMKKLFGIIPREPIHKLLGKYKTHYESHPNKDIERFFLSLLNDALKEKAVDKDFLKKEIEKNHVRADIFECIAQTT